MIFSLLPNLRTAHHDDTTGYLWGKPLATSHILKTLPKDYTVSGDSIAERWLVSDDANKGSLTTDHKQLHLVLQEHANRLFSKEHLEQFGPRLGVIMKLLDTNDVPNKGSLSIQVHPTPTYPTRPAKPEMWYGRGQFYLGWKTPMTSELLQEHRKQGDLETCMHQVHTNEEGRIIVPGGLAHAIRAGSFVYEWSYAPTHADQQKGDLEQGSVGIYDRTDGKTPRPGKEQAEEGFAIIAEANMEQQTTVTEWINPPLRELASDSQAKLDELFAYEGIHVWRLRFQGSTTLALPSTLGMYCEQGSVLISGKHSVQNLSSGGECLIGLDEGEITLQTSHPATCFFWFRSL